MGIANATENTLKSPRLFLPQLTGVFGEVLLDYCSPAAPPVPNNPMACVIFDTLRTCLAAIPLLSSPHKDGWRVEHLTTLAAEPDCGQALASLMTTLVKGEVSNKITDLLSSATLVVLLKKDAETMA
jgi:hypothetical protein